MPPDAAPPIEVWGGQGPEESTTPAWRDGVLAEPKYFSFFQDDPLASYNPNHRGKWRAHELLHGAIPFVWSPTMTRFEIYAGARLQELLPVVHWYGWDEIARARCPPHAAHPGPPRARCAACEAARLEPNPARDEAAARRARDHLDREWRASLREAASGRPHPTPRPGLDASSDAIGYARAHAPRLYAWHTGAWIERFARPGLDYVETLEACAEHVARAALRLTSGAIELDARRAREERARRAASDLGKRALLAVELGRVEADRALALVDALARAARALDPDAIGESARALLDACDDEELGAIGHDWFGHSAPRAAIAQLAAGLESACPTTLVALEGAGVDDLAASAALIADRDFARPEPLAARAARWLERTDLSALSELARLEGWLAAEPRSDEEAARFAMAPDPRRAPDRAAYLGAFRAHATMRRARWSGDALAAVFGDAIDEGEPSVEIAAAVDDAGELLVVLPTPEQSAALDALEAHNPREPHAEALSELARGGLLVWCPRAQRPPALEHN